MNKRFKFPPRKVGQKSKQIVFRDKMIQWISLFLVLALFLSVGTSCASKSRDSSVGMKDNKLLPCPSSPNCVCSEFSGTDSIISPVSFDGDQQVVWNKAIATIEEMGGSIVQNKDNYLHATFTSKIFRFVDDFELRLDQAQKVIHLRSASRIGYSDLGVNRKRAEKFKRLFAAKQDKPDVHPGN